MKKVHKPRTKLDHAVVAAWGTAMLIRLVIKVSMHELEEFDAGKLGEYRLSRLFKKGISLYLCKVDDSAEAIFELIYEANHMMKTIKKPELEIGDLVRRVLVGEGIIEYLPHELEEYNSQVGLVLDKYTVDNSRWRKVLVIYWNHDGTISHFGVDLATKHLVLVSRGSESERKERKL